MIQYLEESCDGLVAVKVTKKLDERDFKNLSEKLEAQINQNVRINFYLEMGIPDEKQPREFWKNPNFNLKHSFDLKKVALVGDGKQKEGMEDMMKAFAGAEIRFFEKTAREQALDWVKSKC